MLSFRNLFRKQYFDPAAPINTSLRQRRPPPPRAWTPPVEFLNVTPSPEARAAFAFFENQTDYKLDDFIQMRFERWKRQQRPFGAIHAMNTTYAWRSEGLADIRSMYRLLFDELNDWMVHDQRNREAARPFAFLAACMWKLGDWDKTASAGGEADFAIHYSGLVDEDLSRLAKGFYGLGMFYWGIDLTGKLKEAAKLGASYDGLLGGQFSVQILQALSRLEALRGDHIKSQDYQDRANALMWLSPAMKLPAPIWQMKVPPGGPYPVDSPETP